MVGRQWFDDPEFRAGIENEQTERQGDTTRVSYRHGRMNVTITVSRPSPAACAGFAQALAEYGNRMVDEEQQTQKDGAA